MTAKTKEPASSPSAIRVFFSSDWKDIPHKSLGGNWIVSKMAQNTQERWIATYANLACQRALFRHIGTTSIQTVIDGLDRGLPTGAVDRVTSLIGINRSALSQVLDISPRTLSRRHTLKASASERLFRVSALFQKALEVIGEKDEAQRWFTTPKKALGGRTPFEFSETDVGAREVEDLLGRIEYGVYA
jgi:putative toxin-antitoxin system antitoxin component (TIGR02293 family)